MKWSPAFVVGSALLASATVGSGLTASGANPDQVDQAAAAILSRARLWAGGPALERVQSIVVSGTEGPRGQTAHAVELRLLRPSRFQSRSLGFTHTLDGEAFWMTSPPDFKAVFTPAMQATAERGSIDKFLDASMAYLGQVPGGRSASATALGRTDVIGLVGDGVRVTIRGREAAATTFVYAPADGRLLGSLRNTSTPGELRMNLVTQHRQVDGIRFPAVIEYRFAAGANIVEWTVSDIKLNTLKASDFRPKAGGD